MIRIIVLFLIARADASLIDAVLQAAFQRKEELFPEWELIYLALPRHDWDARQRYLEQFLKLEKEYGKQQEELQ